MAVKKSSTLYNISRSLYNTASIVDDIENLCSGHPEKIIKKQIRKRMYKVTNNFIKKII